MGRGYHGIQRISLSRSTGIAPEQMKHLCSSLRIDCLQESTGRTICRPIDGSHVRIHRTGIDSRSETLATLPQNIRFGFRRLISNPAISVIIVVTIALGIGANTTIFSVLNAVLLRPLPYPAPDRLVTINHHYPSQSMLAPVSIKGFRNYRDNTSYFEQTGISARWSVNLTGEGLPARLQGSLVTSGYLETFGLTLAGGRYFTPDEETPGNNHVVIISDGFWKRRLGGVSDVINSELQLNGETYTIVGLMPAGFEDLIDPQRELWTPLALTADQVDSQGYLSEWLHQVARIDEGVSIETVTQELVAMAEGLKESLPDNFPEDWTLRLTTLDDWAKQDYRTSIYILAGAVVLVLLITCANVANILLARAIGRRKEIAIRGAIGANRGQIIQQLLTESIILSGTGGLLGLALAGLGIRAVVAFGPPGFDSAGITLDLPVLLFTLLVSLLVGISFGLIPAYQISKTDIQSTLREGGSRSCTDHSGRSLRKVLVAGEFAISLALLSGAGLLIQTMVGLQKVDPGFENENILTANISLPEAKYPDSGSQQAFYHELLTHLEALPGVVFASTTNVLPFGGRWSTAGFGIEGYSPEGDQQNPWGDIRVVSPGFDHALGLRLIRGRFLDETDTSDSRLVCVVDEEMVSRFWSDDEPIGQRITFDDANFYEVIGIVGHTMHEGLDADPRLQVYVSQPQVGGRATNLVIRTSVDPLSLVSAVRQTVLSLDSDQPVSGFGVMEEMIADSIGNRKTTTAILVLFAGLAIMLASLGIYGVMSQMVNERKAELGVRIAFGATGPQLTSMVLKSGLVLAMAGIAVGLLGSLGLSRLLSSQLYGVTPTDPVTLASVTILLFLVATIATFLPALRAARLDPLTSLRRE